MAQRKPIKSRRQTTSWCHDLSAVSTQVSARFGAKRSGHCHLFQHKLGFDPRRQRPSPKLGIGFWNVFNAFPSEPDNIKAATTIHRPCLGHPTWRKISKILPSLMNPSFSGVSLTWQSLKVQWTNSLKVDRQSKEKRSIGHMARPLLSASCGWAIPGRPNWTSRFDGRAAFSYIFVSFRGESSTRFVPLAVVFTCFAGVPRKLHFPCDASIFNAQPTRDCTKNRADFRLTT